MNPKELVDSFSPDLHATVVAMYKEIVTCINDKIAIEIDLECLSRYIKDTQEDGVKELIKKSGSIMHNSRRSSDEVLSYTLPIVWMAYASASTDCELSKPEISKDMHGIYFRVFPMDWDKFDRERKLSRFTFFK